MTSRAPLDETTVAREVATLPGWTVDGNVLEKQFAFSSFREAISFIIRVAFEAEERNHHPELRNVYSDVTIRLTTHDAGNRITALDIALARAIESFSWVAPD